MELNEVNCVLCFECLLGFVVLCEILIVILYYMFRIFLIVINFCISLFKLIELRFKRIKERGFFEFV